MISKVSSKRDLQSTRTSKNDYHYEHQLVPSTSHAESLVIDCDEDSNNIHYENKKYPSVQTINRLIAGSFTKSYTLVNHIGSGSCGEVFTAKKKDEATESFVVKFVKKEDFEEAETDILLKVKGHPNIAQLIGVEKNKRYYQIMMSLDGQLPFDEYLENNPNLAESQLRFYFNQMTSGVEFLHSTNIAHLDLKPDNMILNSNSKLTIIDFGMSVDMEREGNGPLLGAFGTDMYLAPEMLLGEGNGLCYPKEADVWALGVTLFLSFFNVFPYKVSEDLFIIPSGSPYSQVKRGCSTELTDLLDAMMSITFQVRLSIDRVKKHPWSRGCKTSADVTEIKPLNTIRSEISLINKRSQDKPTQRNATLKPAKMVSSDNVPTQMITTLQPVEMVSSDNVPTQSITTLKPAKMVSSDNVPTQMITTLQPVEMVSSDNVPAQSITTLEPVEMVSSDNVPTQSITTLQPVEMVSSDNVPTQSITTLEPAKMVSSDNLPTQRSATLEPVEMVSTDNVQNQMIKTLELAERIETFQVNPTDALAEIILCNLTAHFTRQIDQTQTLAVTETAELSNISNEPTEESDTSGTSELILKGARFLIQGVLTLYHGYWPF